MDASLSPVIFNSFIHQFCIKAIHFSCVNNKKYGIYKVNCKDCRKCYTGQTRRYIETRMKEHCRNIKCFQIDKLQ